MNVVIIIIIIIGITRSIAFNLPLVNTQSNILFLFQSRVSSSRNFSPLSISSEEFPNTQQPFLSTRKWGSSLPHSSFRHKTFSWWKVWCLRNSKEKNLFFWKLSSQICAYDDENFENRKGRWLWRKSFRTWRSLLCILKNFLSVHINIAWENSSYVCKSFLWT